ncbi:MAG: DegT/DnrJ/EryC1/StrS family aminotransferase [Nitrospirae bacterium]|nr:DegT/DnrJ/EryC1/StrS family aminotransferase [Candidatus Manganitrophaceae bacterium]
MKVPLLDLKAHHAPIKDEIFSVFEAVFKSQYFILGPEVKDLEAKIAAYCQTEFAVGVSSGTDALLLALMALDIGAGDEVITTPYTFFATAGVIARVGAKPIFVDIDPVTYNIDPEKIEAAITPRTKLIIPVHLYGQVANMASILDIAERHGLKVVEDAAQAIGAEDAEGKRAGCFGDMGCFSFFPSKNLGAMGDGGIISIKDATLADKVRKMRVHGGHPKYYHKMIGGNFRLDSIQAGIVGVKLKYLDGWTKRRQENARHYAELFEKRALIQDGFLSLPQAVYEKSNIPHYHIYNQFILRVKDRDALRAFLIKEEIGAEIYYPVPLHLQECFSDLSYKKGDFPESEKAAMETLALPIYPELNLKMQEFVVDTIDRFYRK